MNETIFAIYKGSAVQVLEIDRYEHEALISHDNGHEEYVSLETLDFI